MSDYEGIKQMAKKYGVEIEQATVQEFTPVSQLKKNNGLMMAGFTPGDLRMIQEMILENNCVG